MYLTFDLYLCKYLRMLNFIKLILVLSKSVSYFAESYISQHSGRMLFQMLKKKYNKNSLIALKILLFILVVPVGHSISFCLE